MGGWVLERKMGSVQWEGECARATVSVRMSVQRGWKSRHYKNLWNACGPADGRGVATLPAPQKALMLTVLSFV